MKKLILVYNPVVGNGSFIEYLDKFIKKFQNNYDLHILRTTENQQQFQSLLKNLLKNIETGKCQALIVAGGDGTVNTVINIMLDRRVDIPLAVIPAGTVNDFGTYLKMPSDFMTCLEIIAHRNLLKADVGQVNNNTHFINVCTGGLWASVPYETETASKNQLGKIAYYVKGLGEISGIKSIPLRVTTSRKVIEEDVYLFMVLNTGGAGGFYNLIPEARINDGLLELILVKASGFHKIIYLFIELFQKKHLANKNIIYLRDNYFKIERIDSAEDDFYVDLDGEKGPCLPLEIRVKKQALTVYHNRK